MWNGIFFWSFEKYITHLGLKLQKKAMKKLEDFLAWLTALVSFGLLLGIFEEGGLERNVGSMWAPTKTHREMLTEMGEKIQQK